MLVRFGVKVHLDESYDPETGEYLEEMDAYEYTDIANAVAIIDKWRERGYTIERTFLANEYGIEISDTLNVVR